ncbi:MAG: LEPR-XLL domain-containing protein [Phycisphaerales bacterium]|jgi:hypothetical protein|nr:LEPR-XLL domain-containing protein [Phycisphaerales bacterium]
MSSSAASNRPGSVSASALLPALEPLEPRMLLSAAPSPFEQEMLWLINDMRTEPADHLDHFITGYGTPAASSDADIHNALDYFGVVGATLQSDWGALTTVAPLAWSPQLDDAAEFHSQNMITEDKQEHWLPPSPTLGDRILATGYSFSNAGENIFAYTKSALHGHAGFVVDWGYGTDGMQDPPGHRNSIMNPLWVHTGIASIAENDDNTDVGPYVVTQDFARPWTTDRYLVGTIWADADANGRFDGGEGFGGVTVTTVGTTTHSTTSWSAGGYQLQLPAGTYNVSISGGAFEGVQSTQITITDENVKLDATPQDVEIAGRHIFYNNSAWDGNNPAANSNDDAAIAPDKIVLLPEGTVSPANYSSYSRGVNGIMIDIDGLDAAYTPLISDFDIRINESPGTNAWANLPAASVNVRRGQGAGGSDRVTLVWPDGAIVNRWAEITVKSDANGGGLGLASDDVFYFASAVGDTNGDRHVDQSDYQTLLDEFAQSVGSVSPATDLNGDGHTDLADFVVMRTHFGNSVALPTFPAAAPPPTPPQATDTVDETRPDYAKAANGAPLALVALTSVADLLAESPSPTGYLPAPQTTSTGNVLRAATAGYDQRPLSEDPAPDANTDDLLADILAESALSLPL